MRTYTVLALVAGLCLCSVALAEINRQIWDTGSVTESAAGVRDFFADKRPDMMPFTPAPDIDDILDEAYWGDRADQYYGHMWGWVTIPESGNYTWYIHGDNYCVLYVSTDENWENVEEVCWVDGWSNTEEWENPANGGDNTVSDPMEYAAGQQLAVWATMVEGSGGDNLGIGWKLPGSSTIEYITDYVSILAPQPTTAKNPIPETGSVDVPRDIDMSWAAGTFAATHDVYLGTSAEDVNAAGRADPMGVLVSQDQTATTYDPGILEFGQTYYWRVDEVNAPPDSTIYPGKIWQFTVEPFTYAVEGVIATSNAPSDETSGPQKTVDGSGLNADGQHSTEATDMWLCTPFGAESPYLLYEFDQVYKLYEMRVWNYNVMFELMLGFGLKDVTVEYSTDGETWTLLGDVEFAQATAKATYEANTVVNFGGAPVKFVRLTINTGWGPLGQYGLSEVQFMYIPAHAREPQPVDAGTDVPVGTTLDWRAGREAVSHEVYLSADPNAVALAGTADAPTFTPSGLEFGMDYYWKVVEVNEADEVTAWEGALWSFRTQDYALIDGFESYDNEDNRIYDTWIDGWINETGSTVGYLDSPFAEQTIVHSGRQSMPLFYENSNVATAEADLALNQDWTASGIQSLALYFQGDPTNSGGQLFVTINNTTISYDGPGADLTGASWQSWNIDLSAVGGLNNVTSLTIGVEGSGASGVVYIDDIRLYPRVIYPDVTGAGDTVVGVPNDGDWPAAETPDLAVDDDTATKYLHFKGETEPTGLQITPAAGATIVTGITFTTANDAPERDPVAFELYGANDSIDGPYTLIASGDIVDFAGETEWPRFTANATGIAFDNDVAYAHYQVLFPAVRDPGSANSMQIAEVELLGTTP